MLRFGAVCGGGVQERTMLLVHLSVSFQSLPPLPISKLGPSGAVSQGRWFWVRSRALWVSPTNSPVRLGGSPATSSPQVFSVRGFEGFFPHTGTLGCRVCLAPQLFLLVYLLANVGPPTPPAAASPSLVLQPPPCWESSPPCCSSLPLLLVWMNVSSLTLWLSDFHTVWFSVSSGYFCF